MVRRVIAVILICSFVFIGCDKKYSIVEDKVQLPAGVELPAGFAVLKGLSESDYNPQGWPRYIVCLRDGSIMALVDAGEFVMGSSGGDVNEQPAHPVKVGMYYIDIYEVSNVQYAQFVSALTGRLSPFSLDNIVKIADAQVWRDNAGLVNVELSTNTQCWFERNLFAANCPILKARPEGQPYNKTIEPDYFADYWEKGVNDSHPARAVNFWEAWYYARWVGKDLPTEAEWELAAKGVDARIYPWGNIEPDSKHLFCNYGGENPGEDGYEYTAPVSAFASGRSPFGVYNMAGNVWEWCKDNYDSTAYSVVEFATNEDMKASELEREFTNPKGAYLADMKVIRGGSFTSDIRDCRTTSRKAVKPDVHSYNIGFRCVLRIR